MMSATLRNRMGSASWLPELIAFLGAAAYAVQTLIYTFTQDSILDEGAYLLKGYLYLTGQYTVFQENGPWSNHTPLAFLIPGLVQLLFGPGLRAARYFAVLVSLLMLAGTWLVTRRVGGRWWAAGAVLALAWNPAAVKMYSVAVSQGLIACMFVWSLYFVLGEKRALWQISLGAALAGAMWMTRINLAPVLPLLVLYAFWQHGLKAGLTAALSGGLVVFAGHAAYWPNILRLWAYWLPESLTPFLNAYRLTAADGLRFWDPDLDFARRAASFFHSFRFQFIPMLGLLGAWLLWPKRASWRRESDFRSAVYLSSLFAALWLAHLWATMFNDYCVYCLAGYVAFFSTAGLLVLILSFSVWRTRHSLFAQLTAAVLILVLSTGIGFSAFEEIGGGLARLQISRLFLGMPALWNQSAALGEVVVNKFHLDQGQLVRVLSTAFGVAAGLTVLALALLAARLDTRRSGQRSRSVSYWAVVLFLAVGAVFTPSQALGGGYHTYDCGIDVISATETVGEHLAEKIPPGSLVYWRGRLSAAPLLYLPGIKIFPAQINGDYTIFFGGDPKRLVRFGFWNDELARQWAGEADFILVARHYYAGWLRELVNAGGFDELEPKPLSAHCTADAQIRIFRKKP